MIIDQWVAEIYSCSASIWREKNLIETKMNIKVDQHARNAFARFAEEVLSGPKCNITLPHGFGDNVGGGTTIVECEAGTSQASPAPAAKADDDGDPDPEPERRPRGRPRNPDSPLNGGIPPALANFDRLPDAGFVRLPVLTGLLGCSKATIWRRCKLGQLPAPIKLSAGTTAWRVADIRAHIDALGS